MNNSVYNDTICHNKYLLHNRQLRYATTLIHAHYSDVQVQANRRLDNWEDNHSDYALPFVPEHPIVWIIFSKLRIIKI